VGWKEEKDRTCSKLIVGPGGTAIVGRKRKTKKGEKMEKHQQNPHGGAFAE